MRVQVRLFAAARDAAGSDEVAIDLPAQATVREIRAALSSRSPDLARILAASRIAVNRRFAADTDPVADGDEVAVIPPVSGG